MSLQPLETCFAPATKLYAGPAEAPPAPAYSADAKYSFDSFGAGAIVFFPGRHPAGQTWLPLRSVNLNACATTFRGVVQQSPHASDAQARPHLDLAQHLIGVAAHGEIVDGERAQHA